MPDELLKEIHARNGHYDNRPLHELSFCEQMQDNHLTALMPKSDPKRGIDVLAPVNQNDSGLVGAMKEALINILQNEQQIHYVVMAVGPGHWRGVYLIKPQNDTSKYQLEIFDPMGPHGAKTIERFVLDLLGIDESRIDISFSGPPHPQRDGYACGDFTCSYSHKKMLDFGASCPSWANELINMLEQNGNTKHMLRCTTRKISAELSEEHNYTESQYPSIIESDNEHKNRNSARTSYTSFQGYPHLLLSRNQSKSQEAEGWSFYLNCFTYLVLAMGLAMLALGYMYCMPPLVVLGCAVSVISFMLTQVLPQESQSAVIVP